MAELEHPRTTGPTLGSSLASGYNYTSSAMTSSGHHRSATVSGLGTHGTHGYSNAAGLSSTGNYTSGFSIGTSATSGVLTGLSSGSGIGTVGSGVTSTLHGNSNFTTGGITSGVGNAYSSIGVTSSASTYGLGDTGYGGPISSSVGATALSATTNVSPLPIKANPTSSMPPICQVRYPYNSLDCTTSFLSLCSPYITYKDLFFVVFS